MTMIPLFAARFDAYFPEAFEQLGAMVFGQFLKPHSRDCDRCSRPSRRSWPRPATRGLRQRPS